jgi:hypothetical protein
VSQEAINPPPPNTAWDDARRPESWAGEVRVNLLRLLGITLFYARHLIEWLLAPADAPVRGSYHVSVTAIAIAWAGAAVVLHLWLRQRRYPEWLKYATTLLDAFMMTLLCAVAGGPLSPLVLLYFALIATAPLRLSVWLVYVATAAAVGGYLVLLGHYAWYQIGFHKYYSTPELRVPRRQEAIVLLAMLVCGLLAGQTVRQMKRLVLRYVVSVDSAAATPTGAGS